MEKLDCGVDYLAFHSVHAWERQRRKGVFRHEHGIGFANDVDDASLAK
jgi:hypothetical protein